MFKQSLRTRSFLALVLGLSLVSTGAFAQRDDNRADQRINDRGDTRVDSRADHQVENRGDVRQANNRRNDRKDNQGHRYHYRDGRWYDRGWFGWEFAVSALAIGAMVESLPPNHSIVVVGDTSYYYDNTRYYRQLPDGAYVVVQAPR